MLRTMQNTVPMIQRIWRAGAIALAGVVAVNLLIRAVAYAAFDVSNAFPLLHLGPAVLWTAFLVVVFAAVRGLMELRSRDGASTFLTVALASLAILLCIDIMLMLVPVFPGTATSSIATLMVMQGVSTALSIYFLAMP